MEKDQEIMKRLLELYDWHMRVINKERQQGNDDEYSCGYADGIGQVILDLSKLLGGSNEPYKFESVKRLMHFTSVEQYIKDYPKPILDYWNA